MATVMAPVPEPWGLNTGSTHFIPTHFPYLVIILHLALSVVERTSRVRRHAPPPAPQGEEQPYVARAKVVSL